MTKKEKMEMQKFAKKVLFEKLGFAPKLENIILLESGDDGLTITYLMISVLGIENVEYQIYKRNGGYDMCIIKSHISELGYTEDDNIWL